MIATLVVRSVLCAGAVAPAAAPPADLGAQLDALVARHYPADQPGAAVLVRKGDQVLLRKGYGRATLNPAVPVAPEMVFRIGSITKQFTAAAIMLLVDAGKVSLGDDLRKWIPQYPDHGRHITVEQLLTHTSGVPNFTAQPAFGTLAKVDHPTHDQVLAIFKDLPLDFTPGRMWVYSNSGYYLLGMIVEQASGQSYPQFMAEKIFKPLGMEHTRYGDRGPALHDGVRGYNGRESRKEAEASGVELAFAAGALASTVDDLAIWDRAISGGKLLKKDSWRRVFTSMTLPDGHATHYGFGWTLGTYDGHPVQHHSGTIPGFTSNLLRMPDDQLVVVILCNSMPARAPLRALAMALAAVAIGKPIVDPPVVAVTPAVLDQYAGIYARPGKPRYAVRHLGNQLLVRVNGIPSSLKPVPASDTAFFLQGTLVRYSFLRDTKSNRITGMEARDDDGSVEVYPRIDEPLPEQRTVIAVDEAVLERYVGNYEWRPGLILKVTREGAHLYIQAGDKDRAEAFSSSPTEFFLKVTDAQLTFSAEFDGPAQRLVLYQDGRDLLHKRVR